jgi:hypothetical protein
MEQDAFAPFLPSLVLIHCKLDKAGQNRAVAVRQTAPYEKMAKIQIYHLQ